MPQLNVGIVPGGAVGAELSAATRRAFVPALFVNIYKATPTLNLLFGTAQRAAGGVSTVTVPVQGSSYVSFAWTDYSGGFSQPTIQPGLQNAEYNLKVGVVPIAFNGMEALLQATETVIPLMKARMADAKTVAVQSIAGSIFANNSALNTTVTGFPQVFDDGTNVSTLGGINRTTAGNGFWKGQYFSGVGTILTRSAMLRYLVQVTAGTSGGGQSAGGEAPDFAVMSPSDWTTLMQDYLTNERYVTDPRMRYAKDDPVNSGFRGIMLGETPFFMDPFCPKGTCYMFNTKYTSLYVSEDAPFAFSGFYSAIPNLQISNIGVVIIGMELVCAKPSSGAQITGILGGAF